MIIIIILIIIIYFVRQHHFSHYHRQLVSLLADNVLGMHHSVESSFATFKLLTQMSTTGHDYLLLQLHTVVIQVTCTTDFVLWTTSWRLYTLLESLSVSGLASTYVILMFALVAFSLTVVAHMVFLVNEVQANWPDMQLSII